jgi:hypothetical protein
MAYATPQTRILSGDSGDNQQELNSLSKNYHMMCFCKRCIVTNEVKMR